MIESRLAAGEELAEDRQQAQVEAHITAKRQRCRGSAGQGVGRLRAQAAGSGRECTAGGGPRQRTSSGRTSRRTGR
eukprot:2876627-Prymnesium_polylepis.1